MIFRICVLAGASDLLRPDPLEPGEAEALVGGHCRAARIDGWLPAPQPAAYLDMLQAPGDGRRTEVFAAALRQDFGVRHDPLLIFPELLPSVLPQACDSGIRHEQAVDILDRVGQRIRPDSLDLVAASFPDAADPDACWAAPAGMLTGAVRARMVALSEACAAMGFEPASIHARVVEAQPDQPAFRRLQRNALSRALFDRVAPRLEAEGFEVEPERLRAGVTRLLALWTDAGLAPAFRLDAEQIARLADRVSAGLTAAMVVHT
jgi:hypothetical protein